MRIIVFFGGYFIVALIVWFIIPEDDDKDDSPKIAAILWPFTIFMAIGYFLKKIKKAIHKKKLEEN